MSDPIFLTMIGEHHGLVSAGCGSKPSIGRYAQVNHQDQILALSLLSGWGYEKQSERRCISFHKFIDKSTPLLALGINENERYFLEFDFYRINQFGRFEKYYFIELRGASMIALQMNFDTRSGHDTECVTLAYDYIRCRHLIAATEYYHFALPANYNSLFSVQNPIVAARNAAQRSTLNSANVGRLLAAGGVYHQNPQGFKKVAEQLGGDAPKGFNQVLSEQSAGTLMAMGAMIGLGKGAVSHIPSLDKVKKTQQALAENRNQAGTKHLEQTNTESSAYNTAHYPKLKRDLRQQNLDDIARQDPRLAAVVKGDNGKLNYGVGSGTRQEADRLGKIWVGDGARSLTDGKGLVSADGTRVYRFPATKPNTPEALSPTGVQANFETLKDGQKISNGHMVIIK